MWIFSNTRGTDGTCVGRAAATSSMSRDVSPLQNARVAPTSIDTICTTRASTCASGRNMKMTAPGPISTCRSYIDIVDSTLACVSTQPFGGPVVPEVYTIVAGASADTCSWTSSSIDASMPAPRRARSSIVGTPSAGSIAIACSSSGQRSRISAIFASWPAFSQMTTLAPESASTCSHSAGEFVW